MAGTIRPGTGKLHTGKLGGTGKLPPKPPAPPRPKPRLPKVPIKVPVSGSELKNPGGFLGKIGGGLGKFIEQLLAKAGKKNGKRDGEVRVMKQSLVASSSTDGNFNTNSSASQSRSRAPAPGRGGGKGNTRIQQG